MKVSDLMTPNPVTVGPDQDLEAAIGLMVQHRIRALPVVESHELIGIITDRDVKMALGPDARRLDLDLIDPRQLDGSVEWFMTASVETLAETAAIAAAADQMLNLRVGAMPVVDDQDELVGILSLTDVVKAALPLLAAQ